MAKRDYFDQMLMPYAFQPICYLDDEKVYGYEALMRPVGTTPDKFLKAIDVEHNAEASHKVELITVFSALALFGDREGKLFINSFPNECLTDDEFNGMMSIFGKEKMKNLVVEILEYPYIDMEKWDKKRNQIEKAGCLVAVDDFGTGVADLKAVELLKPDIVKLDRSCIRESRRYVDERSEWLNSFLYEVFHMGVASLIEGIESKDDLEAAVESIATFGQGFYFSKPVMPSPDTALTTEVTSFFKMAKHRFKTFDPDFSVFEQFDMELNKEVL